MSRKSMRTLMLSLVAILVLSMAAFAAGEIVLNGSTDFRLRYDGNQFSGYQHLKLDATIKGSSVRITLNDSSSGNWKTVNFWDSWDNKQYYSFFPYRVSVDVKGAYLPGGAKVTTRLGDFEPGLPAYISGQYNKNTLAGIRISDIPVYKNVDGSAFFGWPKYGVAHTLLAKDAQNFLNTGGKVTAKNLIPGMTLDLYAINHDHAEPGFGMFYYGVELKDSKKAKLNSNRGQDELVVFTPGVVPGTNPWGREILVDAKTGKVLKNATNVTTAGEVVPAGQYVISGHGTSAALLDGINVDDVVKVTVTNKQHTGEVTFGAEATGAVAGINYTGKFLGRQVYSLKDEKKFDPIQLVTMVNGDYTLKFDPVTTKLSAGFRMVDKDFAPFARRLSDSDWTNPVDSKRGQIGGNAGLNFKLPLSTTLDLSGDYYNKKTLNAAKNAAGEAIKDAEGKAIVVDGDFDNMTATASITNSHFFGVTAKAAATGTRGVYTIPADKIPADATLKPEVISDSLTTSASLERDWKLPNKDKINTKYSFSTDNVLDKKLEQIKFTNKLAASTTLDLPIVKKVTLEGSGTLVTVNKKTTPTLTGKLKYTFANNIGLEASATKAGQAKMTWYTQITYSTSW